MKYIYILLVLISVLYNYTTYVISFFTPIQKNRNYKTKRERNCNKYEYITRVGLTWLLIYSKTEKY